MTSGDWTQPEVMAFHSLKYFINMFKEIHRSSSEKMRPYLTISKIQIVISRNLEIGSDRKIGFSSNWTIFGYLASCFRTALFTKTNFISITVSPTEMDQKLCSSCLHVFITQVDQKLKQSYRTLWINRKQSAPHHIRDQAVWKSTRLEIRYKHQLQINFLQVSKVLQLYPSG